MGRNGLPKGTSSRGCTFTIHVCSVCISKSFLSAIGRRSHPFLQMTASHSSASLCWIISLKFIICFPSLSPIFLITHSSTFLNHSPPFFLLTPFKLAEGQWRYTSCSPGSTTPVCIGHVLPQGEPHTPDTNFSLLASCPQHGPPG